MNIEEALKSTGKAIWEKKPTEFVAWCEGDIYAFDIETGRKGDRIKASELFIGDWQPYSPEPEIRPEKAGELWGNSNGNFAHTFLNRKGELCFNENECFYGMDIMEAKIAHNKNGWTLLYSPDPERMAEISGVVEVIAEKVKNFELSRQRMGEAVYEFTSETPIDVAALPQTTFKMILEIPKD
jgi:hypothetical protein